MFNIRQVQQEIDRQVSVKNPELYQVEMKRIFISNAVLQDMIAQLVSGSIRFPQRTFDWRQAFKSGYVLPNADWGQLLFEEFCLFQNGQIKIDEISIAFFCDTQNVLAMALSDNMIYDYDAIKHSDIRIWITHILTSEVYCFWKSVDLRPDLVARYLQLKTQQRTPRREGMQNPLNTPLNSNPQ